VWNFPSDELISAFDFEGSGGPVQAGNDLAIEKGQVSQMFSQAVWTASGNDRDEPSNPTGSAQRESAAAKEGL
jgi:hypothetical protein